MKRSQGIAAFLGLLAFSVLSQAATQFSEKDYSLYAGDFNGDGRTDLLYIGKTPDKPNGIALADSSGAPQAGFQSWPATFLGIPWSTGQFIPAIGDFNGDGKADVLMQAATAGTSYVLLANDDPELGAVGQFVGIHQSISQTAFGIAWSADEHRLLVGDFDGDGKDDVLLQAAAAGGTNAIVLADTNGGLFIRSSSYCWSGGPQQCWTDGEQGLKWSTKSAIVTVGEFNGDARADILYQARPTITLIDDEIRIPVPVFKPNTFGIFLGQVPDGAGKIIRTANQLWSHSGLGASWSPLNGLALVGDFDGDGYGDVLLQSTGGSNQLLYGSSVGVLGTAVSPASNVAGWNGKSYRAIVGRFGNSARSVLYLQGKTGASTNYYTSDISAGSVIAYASALQIVANLPVAATAVGATPAMADVTQNGAATYTIPIQLPPGTAGLTPNLSLTYNSGAGNGLVGVGWNISGLGIIARCPKTIAQDNVTEGVKLTADDEYCLNGNRLRRVSGNQGTSGSTYRTELETFALITANGTGTHGPLYFTVKTKDGLIYEYGGTPDSRIGVPGNTSVTRVWALSKVSDRAISDTTGNFWTIKYINDAAGTGAYRPDYIDYTTSSLASPSAAPYRVQFTYENRNPGESVVSYYQGGRIHQTKRLKTVELRTSNGASLIRRYTLEYQIPTSTFNVVSRLASIQESSPTASMAQTTFSWSDSELTSGLPSLGAPVPEYGYGAVAFGSPDPPYSWNEKSFTFDINGDGIPDAYRMGTEDLTYISQTTQWFNLYIGTPTGQVVVETAGSVSGAGPYIGVFDIDEDGKDDFLFKNKYLHQRSDGSYGYDTIPGFAEHPITVDVDGDGYLDIITNPTSSRLDVRFHKRDGDLGFEATTTTAWSAPAGTTILASQYQPGGPSDAPIRSRQSISQADVDGDGRQDLLVMVNTPSGGGWFVLYSTGAGFTAGPFIETAGNSLPSYFPPVPIDIDGDGCTDLAYVKGTSPNYYWYLAKSSCGSLTIDVPTGIAVTGLDMWFEDWGGANSADFNNDGYSDLASGTSVLLSNGTTLVPHHTGTVAPGLTRFWADRNGDGVLDFVSRNNNGWNGYQYQPGLGKRGNYLVSATDGFGKVVAFDYAPMTSSSVYTRGTGTFGRTRDMQTSMYLVKTMTLSDGIGGAYTQSYHYSGAKRNIQGRGFLGFASREITDSRTGFVTREVYNNTVHNDGSQWEYVGTLASRTTYQYKSGDGYGPKVEDLTRQWNAIQPGSAGNRRYPYVYQSVVKHYELTGTNSPYATETTTTLIDDYGTPYDVTTTTVEGTTGLNPGSSSVVRAYTPLSEIVNNTTYWCIAKPKRLEDRRSHTLNVTDGAEITRVITQVWDEQKCRVTQRTVAPGSGHQLNTAIEYDNFNNIDKLTVTGDNINAAPIITEWNYGDNGHLLQWMKNPENHFTSYGWWIPYAFKTSETVRLSEADPNAIVTNWVPDDFGREREMIRPDQTRTYKRYFNCTSSNGYCGDSLLRYVVRTEERNTANDGNNLINYKDEFFDALGRAKYEQSRGFDGQIVVTERLYDNRGNVALQTNPYYAGAGSVSGVSMTYDSLGRVTETRRPRSDSDPTVVSEHLVYEGLKTRTFDGNGLESSEVANVLGTISRATDSAGKYTTYTYNGFGELLSAGDSAGNVSSIHYIAARGFKDYSDDPDMGHTSFTYDALGQVLTQTDAKNQTTTFTYDSLGRTKTRIDHGGGAANTTTFTWDTASSGYGVGQLAGVTSPGGYSETFNYDNKGRRSQHTTVAAGTSFVVDYSYHASLGTLETVTYPASTGPRLTVKFGYQNGFAKDVRDLATDNLLWQANAQDAGGHVTQEQFGNGQITSLGFDQTNGRLYSISTGIGGVTQNLSYNWDSVGNLLSRRDNNQGIQESFGYDVLYRLTSVQRNGDAPLTVTYDDIGNITSKSLVGSYAYTGAQAGCSYTDLTAQPHAVRNAGGSIYCYDANGNMTKRAGATLTWSTYDYPLTINDVSGNTTTFYYGANRNRYRQVSVDGAVTEDLITTPGGLFEKLVRTGGSNPGTEFRHFIQVSGKVVAIVKRSLQTGDDTFYLHQDHLGSTDVITNAAGAVVVRQSFDAWGQRRGTNWTGVPSAADKAAINGTTHRGFTGHEQLDNLNLVHMNGRVYDPIIARFLSADPIIQDPYQSQSFNRYAYAWNNPLNATDPTGFCTKAAPTGSRIARGSPDCPSSSNESASSEPVSDNGSRAGAATGTPPSTDASRRSAQVNQGGQESGYGTPTVGPDGRLEIAVIGTRPPSLLRDARDVTWAFLANGGNNVMDSSPLIIFLGDAPDGYRWFKGPGTALGDQAAEFGEFLSNFNPAKRVRIVLGGIERGATAAARGAVAGAQNVANASKLAKQLGSQEGVAELLSGGGKAIAGAGTKVPLRDVGRLVSEHGGRPGDWAKITSTAEGHLQTHAYRNVVTGEVIELKSIIP
jgi:RHS repeat-associated protein